MRQHRGTFNENIIDIPSLSGALADVLFTGIYSGTVGEVDDTQCLLFRMSIHSVGGLDKHLGFVKTSVLVSQSQLAFYLPVVPHMSQMVAAYWVRGYWRTEIQIFTTCV